MYIPITRSRDALNFEGLNHEIYSMNRFAE